MFHSAAFIFLTKMIRYSLMFRKIIPLDYDCVLMEF